MLSLVARRYDTAEPVRVQVDKGRIVVVEPTRPEREISELPCIAPGFFDLQINGHGGIWFSNEELTAEEVLTVLRAHYQYGITRMCPTLVTNSFEALLAGFEAIRRACEQEQWADRMTPGCHLEGPYISAEDGPRGAHPLEHVRGCDWLEFEQLQTASGGRIRLVTLAAEADRAVEFIEQAVATGVRIAIGHTAANTEQIAAAVAAGATLSTHLGNGAHGTIRRHPNYIWDQLADDRLTASIITDGHHLPASVVKTMIRAKTPSRIVITCDASGLAGCQPGIYECHGSKVEVLADGPIVIAGQRQLLAGSGQQTDVCVANAVSMGRVTLGEACDMASRNPARLLGFEEVRLRRGSRADLVLFDHDPQASRLQVTATIADGAVVFGELP